MLNKNEIITLVHAIQTIRNKSDRSTADVDEMDRLINSLEDGVSDPDVYNYLFGSSMTIEEIADRVLAYRPIQLPPP